MHIKTYDNDDTVPKMKNTLIKDEQQGGGDKDNEAVTDEEDDTDIEEDSDDIDSDERAGDEGIDDDESDQDDPLPESGILGSQGGA